MYPLCYIHHFAFALVILLDIIRTNGSLNNITDTTGFQWISVSTPIASCKGQDVIFNWSYQIGKYAVGARTWFKDIGKNAERIAYWNQAQGFVHEAKFKDRVERIGEDGLLLKSVTPKDDNTYTLIVRFPLSSDEDPKQNITLTVYEPPLEGCCRPTLHRLKNGIGRKADLNLQACGTQPIDFKWDSLARVSTNGSIANFESNDVSGTIRVCVTGIAVQKCYKGDPTSLCQEEYIEKISTKEEQNMMLIIIVSVFGTIIILTVAVILVWCLCKRKLQKCAGKGYAKTMDEQLPLTDIEQSIFSSLSGSCHRPGRDDRSR